MSASLYQKQRPSCNLRGEAMWWASRAVHQHVQEGSTGADRTQVWVLGRGEQPAGRCSMKSFRWHNTDAASHRRATDLAQNTVRHHAEADLEPEVWAFLRLNCNLLLGWGQSNQVVESKGTLQFRFSFVWKRCTDIQMPWWSGKIPRLCGNAREGVALGVRPRELLNVRKNFNNNSLLQASNGTTSRLLHQEEHSLAVPVLAGVDFLFVGSKVCVVHESGVLAQVAHQRTTENGVLLKKKKNARHASSLSSSSSTWSSSLSSPTPSSSLMSSSVAQAVVQPVCLCRLTPFHHHIWCRPDGIDI